MGLPPDPSQGIIVKHIVPDHSLRGHRAVKGRVVLNDASRAAGDGTALNRRVLEGTDTELSDKDVEKGPGFGREGGFECPDH